MRVIISCIVLVNCAIHCHSSELIIHLNIHRVAFFEMCFDLSNCRVGILAEYLQVRDPVLGEEGSCDLAMESISYHSNHRLTILELNILPRIPIYIEDAFAEKIPTDICKAISLECYQVRF